MKFQPTKPNVYFNIVPAKGTGTNIQPVAVTSAESKTLTRDWDK